MPNPDEIIIATPQGDYNTVNGVGYRAIRFSSRRRTDRPGLEVLHGWSYENFSAYRRGGYVSNITNSARQKLLAAFGDIIANVAENSTNRQLAAVDSAQSAYDRAGREVIRLERELSEARAAAALAHGALLNARRDAGMVV